MENKIVTNAPKTTVAPKTVATTTKPVVKTVTQKTTTTKPVTATKPAVTAKPTTTTIKTTAPAVKTATTVTKTVTKPVTKTVVSKPTVTTQTVKTTTQPKQVVTAKPTATVTKTTTKPVTTAKTTVTTKPVAKTITTKPTTTTSKIVATPTKIQTKVVTKQVTTAPKTVATKPVTTKPTGTVQTERISPGTKLKNYKMSESMKNAIELINIFQKLENNLVDVLQTIPAKAESEDKGSVIESIKAYKKKVELAREIFDEYENTSHMITKFIESQKDDKESIEIYKHVIGPDEDIQKVEQIDEKDLLNQIQVMEKQGKGMQKIEIETVGGTVVVKRKPAMIRENAE